ncbi:BatA (Bacteroides aerotolerance operon) [hydrothermal vent metagenome]|uniref:BatA (Bacteroides aerotolerance operon) n=1 Tax=hydrothermal vent metagenome TaxID=652676 RepID=A0A1W1D2H0_9ZZZZ
MFDGIYFEHPYIFLLFFVFIVCEYFCPMQIPSFYFPHITKFMQPSTKNFQFLFFFKWLSIVMVITALASPVKEESFEDIPRDGYEIGLIIDASSSMQSRGFDKHNQSLHRFDVVKEIVNDFVYKRKNDFLGLVVFGKYSFIASPLTYDKKMLQNIISHLEIGIAGQYTSLYEALAQSVNLLQNNITSHKIAILLTDGYSTKEFDTIPLDTALELVKDAKIKVYPIGIGKEYNKNILQKIARETGGKMFEASNKEELWKVYQTINTLEPSKVLHHRVILLKYYYFYPLFVGLLSLILFVYFRNKRDA